MTEEEIKATYPEYTVYIYEENGAIVQIQPFDFYAKRGKTYEECVERMKGKEGWREAQNSDLYQVTKMLEKEKRSLKCLGDYIDRLSDISNELDNITNDMQKDVGEVL